MKLYTDKITAQTSNREIAKYNKKTVAKLKQRKPGQYKLRVNTAIFTFKTAEKRLSFIDRYKDQIISESGVNGLKNYNFEILN